MQDMQAKTGQKLQQAAESISAASAKLDSSTGQEVPSLQAALSLADAVDALQQGVAAEGFCSPPLSSGNRQAMPWSPHAPLQKYKSIAEFFRHAAASALKQMSNVHEAGSACFMPEALMQSCQGSFEFQSFPTTKVAAAYLKGGCI